LTETVTHLHLQNTTINQLSAAGADMRELHFDVPCAIYSLIADGSTIPHPSIPTPTVVSLPDRTTMTLMKLSTGYDTSLMHQFSSQGKASQTRSVILVCSICWHGRSLQTLLIKDGDEKGCTPYS
jgi:hypothetical protein